MKERKIRVEYLDGSVDMLTPNGEAGECVYHERGRAVIYTVERDHDGVEWSCRRIIPYAAVRCIIEQREEVAK